MSNLGVMNASGRAEGRGSANDVDQGNRFSWEAHGIAAERVLQLDIVRHSLQDGVASFRRRYTQLVAIDKAALLLAWRTGLGAHARAPHHVAANQPIRMAFMQGPRGRSGDRALHYRHRGFFWIPMIAANRLNNNRQDLVDSRVCVA